MIADGFTIEEAKERHQDRRAIGMLHAAVKNQWPISEAMIDAAPKIAAKVMLSEQASARDKLRAVEVLAAMKRDNVTAIVALDKLERLDSGQNTENITLTMMPPRVARLHANPDTGPD